MKVKFGDLESGTIFEINGKTLKKTNQAWLTTSQRIEEESDYMYFNNTFESKADAQYCQSAIIKLGGKFQSKIGYLIPKETLVEVN